MCTIVACRKTSHVPSRTALYSNKTNPIWTKIIYVEPMEQNLEAPKRLLFITQGITPIKYSSPDITRPDRLVCPRSNGKIPSPSSFPIRSAPLFASGFRGRRTTCRPGNPSPSLRERAERTLSEISIQHRADSIVSRNGRRKENTFDVSSAKSDGHFRNAPSTMNKHVSSPM